MEITSPYDGVVKEILVQEGDVAKVGAGLCLIEVDEEVVEGLETVDADASRPPMKEDVVPEDAPAPSSSASPTSPRRLHPLDPKFSEADKDKEAASANVLATPSVRHFARTKGVELAKLAPGSGKAGRIEKKDVEAYLAGGSADEGASTPQADTTQDVVVELGRTRYGMWKAMVKVRGLCHLFLHSFLTRLLLPQSLEIPHFG